MRDKNLFFYQYPRPSDKVDIYNPKKVIGENYPKAAEMLNRFKIMQAASPYEGKRDILKRNAIKALALTLMRCIADLSMTDLADSMSMPAFFSIEAIEAMEKVVEKAAEIEKKEREEMIMNFVMGALRMLPHHKL